MEYNYIFVYSIFGNYNFIQLLNDIFEPINDLFVRRNGNNLSSLWVNADVLKALIRYAIDLFPITQLEA